MQQQILDRECNIHHNDEPIDMSKFYSLCVRGINLYSALQVRVIGKIENDSGIEYNIPFRVVFFRDGKLTEVNATEEVNIQSIDFDTITVLVNTGNIVKFVVVNFSPNIVGELIKGHSC